MEMDEARLKISKALILLMRDQPFFASILYTMRHVYTENLLMPTMAVDGFSLFIHPEFVAKHDVKRLAAVLAHEAMHVVFKHHLRRGARDAKAFNVAADYAINPIVRQCGLELPHDCLFRQDLEGMAAEAIYELLGEDHLRSLFDGALPGSGMFLDPEGNMSDAERAEAEAMLEANVRAAAQQAKAMGKLPGNLSDLVEAAFEHKVTWQDRLRHSLGGTGNSDFTWRKPNRRAMSMCGTLMPGMQGMETGDIVIAVDTSGSISKAEATAYLAEINGIVEECSPRSVWVIQCDAEIQDEQEVFGVLPELNIKGRGGTAFQPVIDWIAALPVPPQALIYMTDLEGDDPSEPDCDVIWLCSTHNIGPYGDTIHLET